MNPKLRIYVLSIFATLFGHTVAQAQSPVLYRDARQGSGVKERPDPIVIRSRDIVVDLSLLKDKRINTVTMPLFDRKSIRVVRGDLRAERKDGLIWTGTVAGQPGSTVTFAIVGSVVAGNIATGDGKSYQIRYAGRRIHSLREIDGSRVPREREPLRPEPRGRDPRTSAASLDTCTTDSPDTIDIMVVYSTYTLIGAYLGDESGVDAIMAIIYLAVEETNQTFINSAVNTRLRLVHVAPVNYADSGDLQVDLNRVKNGNDNFMDEVPVLRDTYGADIVGLMVEISNDAYVGMANMMTTNSNAFESEAYFVVREGFATVTWTFAHEVGHVMAAQHENPYAGVGVFPFARGYFNIPQSAVKPWKTIMTTPFTSSYMLKTVPYWSNPNINYPPTGTPMGQPANMPNPSDNALALNTTAPTVANFRCSSPGRNDVWMKDTWNDTGAEPDPLTAGEDMWASPYIWVRNTQDTALTHQHEHQNPEYGQTNWVYVKLHNGSASPQTGQVDLRFAHAATGILWPVLWTALPPVTVTIPPHSVKVVEVPWTNVPTNADPHYCMIARWDSGSDPMTFPEGPSVTVNTRENNNIVSRNMNVVNYVNKPQKASFTFRNISVESANLMLSIQSPPVRGAASFFKHGQMVVSFDDKLFGLVRRGFKRQAGVRVEGRNFIIDGPAGVTFDNIAAAGAMEGRVTLTFIMNKDAPQRRYVVNATEYGNGKTRKPQTIGGVSYEIYNYKH
jgi:hypothetical protein